MKKIIGIVVVLYWYFFMGGITSICISSLGFFPGMILSIIIGIPGCLVLKKIFKPK
ncbi:hypothetical protein SH2C18_03390 [Clostridium sediminicola]|uniref:hypothetical protein n=1 Tax=Clostridium sediminicola TaxID=3114879 RepID=UPI0031F24FB8